MGSEDVRICVVGDELVAGIGDGRALGWIGRVVARTETTPPPASYVLAVPGETTTELAARWDSETSRRFDPGTHNLLVIGLGAADLRSGLSLARSRLNLANILDSARNQRISAFVVGPPPLPGVDPEALAALSSAFADVATRRQVPYVETFAPLRQHDQWLSDVATTGGEHPGQAGYGLIAWLVLHNGWHDWVSSLG